MTIPRPGISFLLSFLSHLRYLCVCLSLFFHHTCSPALCLGHKLGRIYLRTVMRSRQARMGPASLFGADFVFFGATMSGFVEREQCLASVTSCHSHLPWWTHLMGSEVFQLRSPLQRLNTIPDAHQSSVNGDLFLHSFAHLYFKGSTPQRRPFATGFFPQH